MDSRTRIQRLEKSLAVSHLVTRTAKSWGNGPCGALRVRRMLADWHDLPCQALEKVLQTPMRRDFIHTDTTQIDRMLAVWGPLLRSSVAG